MTSTISILHPTITDEPPVMVGLVDRPLPVCCDTPHCYYVRGFDHTVGVTLPDLQNRWRRIANNPRAFVDEAIAGAEAELDRLAQDDPDDESESVARELYTFRVVRLLLDHAVENQKRLPPTLTTADFDAAILALPNVTRVRRHGGVLRVLVADHLPEVKLSPTAAYQKNEALLHLARLVAVAVRHNEDPDRLLIEFEPGSLPDGYELKEGEDCDGEDADQAGVGGCLPTKYWPIYHWELPLLDDAGSRFLEKAKAIDDAWDDFAAAKEFEE